MNAPCGDDVMTVVDKLLWRELQLTHARQQFHKGMFCCGRWAAPPLNFGPHSLVTSYCAIVTLCAAFARLSRSALVTPRYEGVSSRGDATAPPCSAEGACALGGVSRNEREEVRKTNVLWQIADGVLGGTGAAAGGNERARCSSCMIAPTVAAFDSHEQQFLVVNEELPFMSSSWV